MSATPDSTAKAPTETVRPVGTWVLAGFLTTATLVIWGLVALILQARS